MFVCASVLVFILCVCRLPLLQSCFENCSLLQLFAKKIPIDFTFCSPADTINENVFADSPSVVSADSDTVVYPHMWISDWAEVQKCFIGYMHFCIFT